MLIDLWRSWITFGRTSPSTFKTYPDSRLASLHLDKPDDLPIHVLRTVFDVVLDPLFKTEEIMPRIRGSWDIRLVAGY